MISGGPCSVLQLVPVHKGLCPSWCPAGAGREGSTGSSVLLGFIICSAQINVRCSARCAPSSVAVVSGSRRGWTLPQGLMVVF